MLSPKLYVSFTFGSILAIEPTEEFDGVETGLADGVTEEVLGTSVGGTTAPKHDESVVEDGICSTEVSEGSEKSCIFGVSSTGSLLSSLVTNELSPDGADQ